MSKITLILDNIRSAYNVGSIARSCDGFGVSEIMACGLTPYPALPTDTRLPHVARRATNQISKTALGAEKTVKFKHFTYTRDGIEHLAKNNYKIWALEQHARSVAINQIDSLPDQLAIILGNEVDGVDSELSELIGKFIEIPMQGAKESFNVSVSAGILLYALSLK